MFSPSESGRENAHSKERRWIVTGIDLGVTLCLWFYFTVGFLAFFSPFYFLSAVAPIDRAAGFQRLNHFFYKGFFLLCRLLMPRQQWHIDPEMRSLRSSVIVCNHISYIDPILLISLFKRHTTIVKARLFKIPVFGMMLKFSGYIPSAADGALAGLMMTRMETLCGELSRGTNLIVFPEGTRSRDAKLGAFNAGAFKIARRCRLPIEVVVIRNSQRLFMPGRFLFNSRRRNTIYVESVARIMPDYDAPGFSISDLMTRVRRRMQDVLVRTSLTRDQRKER
jgi:1-acyl-sn-glycerol-3-phosphate acyltransferase